MHIGHKLKTALVLSGGGSKGAFQLGAERVLREQAGFHWDVIAGVSVGALNAAMLSMGKYSRLWEIWRTLSHDRFFNGRFSPLSVARALTGAMGLIGNDPLWQLIEREFNPALLRCELRVGAVSLTTGEYVRFSGDDPAMARAILASTSMPLLWRPTQVNAQATLMVDGAVRNISPLYDVLDCDPDRIVVINCNTHLVQPLARSPRSLIGIMTRTAEIMFNEIFRQDVSVFARENALLQQASALGLTLSRDGQPLRPVELIVIEPTLKLANPLDFERSAIELGLRHGAERAAEVLNLTHYDISHTNLRA
jgi:NTE family protein